MKIAITGSNGLLGQHLVNLLLQAGHQVVAISIGEDRSSFLSPGSYSYYIVDITDPIMLDEVLSAEKPEVLVHAAAITQVDECQVNPEKCERVNVQGTMHAIGSASRNCRHLIYISTDFVFSGVEGDYAEEAEARPINFYGKTKLDSELLVKECIIPWTIVRTCLVYGNALTGTRSNIISWVKQNLEMVKNIKVVNDQFRTPTYIEDLARGILLIIQKKATGVYHISGKDVLTPYDMAVQAAGYLGLNSKLIEEVNASIFTQPAQRPPKTGFNISKAQKELGYEPLSFWEGLSRMFPKK